MTSISHIDGRTIQEIALENQHLKEKLKYNIKCLNVKKNELKLHRLEILQKEKLTKPRITFAFRINVDGQIDTNQQKELREILEKQIKDQGKKIMNLIILNNFIYIKTNGPIILNENYSLCTGHIAQQIEPKDFLKMQI